MATAQLGGAQSDTGAKVKRTEYAQGDTKSQELSQNEHDVNEETGTMVQAKMAKSLTMPRYEKERKIGHRRVDDTGQVTYKKKSTSELMAAIQLGIGQSVGALASKPERDLLIHDFTIVESMFYPREGSNLTPAHHYSDFRFKTYAPIAFRYFRELFSIQPDDFLLSMCNEPLLELSNPGASGSIFYITADDEFIIKTVQHKEADFLQKLLPGYYMNLNQNPRTLLPKFYGLYCYQCGGKNIRFVVMNNLLPSSIKMHEKYDLKGSTYKRKASKHERAKKSPTLKDLDFMDNHPEGLMLEADTYTALIKTIERDCRVLQSFKIMDYSLLLGIHNLDQVAKEKEQQQGFGGGKGSDRSTQMSSQDDSKGMTRGRSVRQRVAQYSTAMEAIQAKADPLDLNDDDIPPGGIPARNSKGERLLLYLGIIDILQNYWLKKRLEHAMKSMVTDGDTISVHRPGFYAQRFQTFFRDKVFKKISSLDQPQVKGPHMRFKKMVQLALRQSPSKKKSLTTKARTLTDVEGRIAEKYMADSCNMSQSHDSDHGEVGGRPDLLPANATPPRLSLDGSQYKYQEQHRSYSVTSTRPSVVMTSPSFQSEVNIGSSAMGASLTSDRQPSSPAPSFSESTPTHTEYTEGTPSFTTSSASVYSDMLDSTPVLPSRSGSSRHSDHSAADTGQVHIELHEQQSTDEQKVVTVAAEVAVAVAAAAAESRTVDSSSQDHSTHHRGDADANADVAKQDVVKASQHSSSPVQSNQHSEEPESITVTDRC